MLMEKCPFETLKTFTTLRTSKCRVNSSLRGYYRMRWGLQKRKTNSVSLSSRKSHIFPYLGKKIRVVHPKSSRFRCHTSLCPWSGWCSPLLAFIAAPIPMLLLGTVGGSDPEVYSLLPSLTGLLCGHHYSSLVSFLFPWLFLLLNLGLHP